MLIYALSTPGNIWVALPPGEPVIINDIGYSYGTVTGWPPDERAAHGIAPIEDEPVPEGMVSTGSRIEDRDGKPVRVHDLVDIDLEDARSRRLDDLAEIRWRMEEAGTTLSDGSPIPTDRTTRGKITAAYMRAKADPSYIIPNWKFAPGVFGPLDAASITTIGDAIGAHVQACFDREAALSADLVAAETVEAIWIVDLQAGWPGP